MLRNATIRAERLQQLGGATTKTSRTARRVGQRGYASESEGKSFKGQLYDSTAQRLQRERADQLRFAEIRAAQKGSGGSPIWMVPLGIFCSRSCLLRIQQAHVS
jgi:D-lactate dehydrogenase (cytochrome)